MAGARRPRQHPCSFTFCVLHRAACVCVSLQLSQLQAKMGESAHRAGVWCLNAIRSKAYGAGTSDWITVSFSGDVIIWRDPLDTGAKLTSVRACPVLPTALILLTALTCCSTSDDTCGV